MKKENYNVKEIAKTNLFLAHIKDIEKVSKENNVDALVALSMWYHKYSEKLEPTDYQKQVKEFRKICVAYKYNFAEIYKDLGI